LCCGRIHNIPTIPVPWPAGNRRRQRFCKKPCSGSSFVTSGAIVQTVPAVATTSMTSRFEPLVALLADLDATAAIGRRLGALLFPGAVVALLGTLGAGKTQLVRAIAEGAGIADSRVVSSPTFVLIQEYEARWPIYHFDAYRLRGAAELFDLGVHEYFEGRGVCLVEWADRVEECLPAEHLRIVLEVTGETSRRLTLTGRGERYEALLAAVAAAAPRNP
jgi:tRNA threonylcarbamoyladenosine biosynthesis protein TsaE